MADRFSRGGDGQGDLVARVVDPGLIEIDGQRQRIELVGFLDLAQSLVGTSDHPEVVRVGVMRGGVARIERDAAAQRRFRLRPFPVVHDQHDPQRRVAFSHQRIEIDGPLCGGARFRHHLAGRLAVEAEHGVRVGQAGVGERVRRIEVDRFFEVLERGLESFHAELVPVVASAQIFAIGVGIDGRGAMFGACFGSSDGAPHELLATSEESRRSMPSRSASVYWLCQMRRPSRRSTISASTMLFVPSAAMSRATRARRPSRASRRAAESRSCASGRSIRRCWPACEIPSRPVPLRHRPDRVAP